jgi:beta-carotene hydroxylase
VASEATFELVTSATKGMTMSPSGMTRPGLPRELYQPNAAWSLLFIVGSVGTFVGFGLLAARVAGMDAPLWIRLLAVPPLLLASQQGVHLLGWVGHEGIHLSLHRNRYVSVIVGSFVSAMALFVALGYATSHWNHHRFTNQDSDPDVAIYPRLKSFWSRFFLARALAQRGYSRAVVTLALGRPLPFRYTFPLPAGVQRTLARLNLAFLLFWLSAYAAFAACAPFTALFAIALPLLLVIPFSGLRIYVEHAGADVGIFRDSRSYVSALYTVMFFANNYHLEHHLYPTVPCYNLPAVHRILRDRGDYDRWASLIDSTLIGPIVHTTAASQYPASLGADRLEDPCRPGVVQG